MSSNKGIVFLGWYVYSATEVKCISAPVPAANAIKAGHETAWLQWKPGKRYRITEKSMREALQNIEKLNNKNSALEFYSKFGPLAEPFIPGFCRFYHEGVYAVPLDSILAAAGTLRIMQYPKMLRDQELEKSVKFLTESWEHLPEKVKRHARPLREVLLVPKNNCFVPHLSYDVPAWIHDYCLYAPIEEGSGIKWGSLHFKRVKFNTEVAWQPGHGADIVLPKFFGLLADFLLKQVKTNTLCACGCGLPARPGSIYYDSAHRKRVWWKKEGESRRKEKNNTPF